MTVRSMIMRNHGLTTVGETVAEAFMRMYWLVYQCRIATHLHAMGRPHRTLRMRLRRTTPGRPVGARRPAGTNGRPCSAVRTESLRTTRPERRGRSGMGGSIDTAADRRLLDATLAYVAGRADSKLDAFREAVADWGADWTGGCARHLSASDLLADALPLARIGTAERELMSHYVEERATRCWEQSYSAADEAVSADMLAGYGYTEIVGKRGPFLSERIRAGGRCLRRRCRLPRASPPGRGDLCGPRGLRTFRLGGNLPERQSAGAVVHVTSQLVHGITMDAEPLVILYLWQGGDLREKSTFV